MDATYNNNLNGRTLNAAIDFDFIVNTDMGLIRFIRNNFQDSRAFNLDVLNMGDRIILSLLYLRVFPNPLSIISTEENFNDIDKLYDSFFENYKQDIIDLSLAENAIVDFVHMVTIARSNFGINPFIFVRDEIEKQEIVKHFNFTQFVNKSDTIGIKSKDPYYIKDYRFFLDNGIKVTDIEHKKIYTSPMQYNINYFEENESPLTRNNAFMLMGKDWRPKEINSNEQYDDHTSTIESDSE